MLLAVAPSVSAQETAMEFSGRIGGVGTYFEIEDSEYLNIALESTEEIKIILESIPKMISINIDNADNDIDFADLILTGLEPNKTYYKYENSYRNMIVFIADENGIYNWTQEINQPQHIWIQETKSTVFLPNNCDVWDEESKTCFLNHNLGGSAEITADNFTLDCNGYGIIGSTNSGYGLYLNSRSGVNIIDCTINHFSSGIYLYNSNNNNFTYNIISDNSSGIYLAVSDNNRIADNNIINNRCGIYLVCSADNMIAGNNILDSSEYGIYFVNNSDPNNSDSNIITDNNISNSGVSGIRFQYSHDNIATDNTFFNNKYGVFVYAIGNKVYHNNFIKNYKHAHVNYVIDFDNGYPAGGNYWDDYSGADLHSGSSQDQPNYDGIGDIAYVLDKGQDNYPFMKENGWEGSINPSTISDFGQFESDKTTSIVEGETVTESAVVFKAMLNDPDSNQVKLQIELRKFNESFTGTDDGGILNSDFVDAGNEAMITKSYLGNYQYHWRARAVNSQGSVSEWQEFGEAGNVDFIMKAVPLYTPVKCSLIFWSREVKWADEDYAKGLDYGCGSTVADCGCAVTSMIMVGRFYNIDTGIDDSNTDPGNINNWLNKSKGYSGPNVYWSKAVEYLGYIDGETKKKMVRLSFDHFNVPFASPKINTYLNDGKPIVAKSDTYGHYFVVDSKTKVGNVNTYTVKDPYWYNTKTLNDTKNIAKKVQGYKNRFTKANLFSYLETPRKIAASMRIYLASPAELVVIDPEGRKLGRDPINSMTYDEIPDSGYTAEGDIISSDDPPDEIHETKIVYIPNPIDGLYGVQVIGTGAGDYTLTYLIYDNEGESKKIIQEGNIAQDDIKEFELDYSTQDVQQAETHQIVDIDIKPCSKLNIIRIKSWGLTRVAILSDQFFDAREIVIDSVLFAGANPLIIKRMPLRWKFRDVDKDGDLDLILYFRNKSLDLNYSDTEAVLTGKLNDGTLIKGSDLVRVLGRWRRK